jgi:signal transduction histidine kinase
MDSDKNSKKEDTPGIWQKISLRTRIYILLAALVIIPLIEGMIMIWYTLSMEQMLTEIVEKDMVALQVAEGLETALVNQRGFVTYYFLDGNTDWLRQLGEYRRIFREKLEQAALLADTPELKNAILEINTEYQLYLNSKDEVISLYERGERDEGSELHKQVRQHFFRILQLCRDYKHIHPIRILSARQDFMDEMVRLRIIAVVSLFGNFLMVLLLIYVLINQILGPVRQLSLEADREGGLYLPDNEIKALSRSVRGLIEDVDTTHSELKKSREHLFHSEKMAMIGKLAAGMAHSIRNPFTSVKMRLFSLSRSSNFSETQKDDIHVISEEIRHIDTIVQNFLEFSRPPRLKMQTISPSNIVDSTIQLLAHRLKSYDVEVKIIREKLFPEMQADPEQLKEALVNLVINACEAMGEGGKIIITEEESCSESQKHEAIIRVSDNGPGIPKIACGKIFQPFYSTKEEGTGLGLSIASRIIHEHGGKIEVNSYEGKGTTFIIKLPIKGGKVEHYSDN